MARSEETLPAPCPLRSGPALRADRLRGWLLCALLLTCAPAFSTHFTSYLVLKDGVLALGLAAAAACVLLRKRFSWAGVSAFLPLWLLLCASAVVHIGLGFAAVPPDTLIALGRGALLLLFGALIFDLASHVEWRRRLTNAWLASVVLVAILALGQYAGILGSLFPTFPGFTQRMYSVFGNQDLLAGYLAMAAPVFFYRLLQERCALRSAASLLVIALPLALSGSRSGWVAAFAGIAVCLLASERPRGRLLWGAIVVVGAAIAALCLEPALIERLSSLLRGDSVGFRARIWFWDGTLRMIRDHWLVGVGPANYAFWSPGYLGAALEGAGASWHYHNALHTRYAHSDPLELAAETGVIGVVFFLWMLTRLFRRRGWEWGPLAAYLVFSLANFPAQSTPHVLGALLFAGLLLADTEKPTCLPLSNKRAAQELPVLALLLAAFTLWASVYPSWLLGTANLKAGSESESLSTHHRAAAYAWPSAEAWLRYGLVLLESGHYEEAISALEQARNGLDTGELYYALAVASAYRGDFKAARAYLEACLYRTPSHKEAVELARLLGEF